MSSTDDNGCPVDWGVFDYGLGWVLVVGTVVSFLPQHIKICQLSSHQGLSFSCNWLGCVIAHTSLLNYMALEYTGTFWCCGEGTSRINCTGAYLAFLQLILIDICCHLVLFLYMVYYDHEFASHNEKIPGTDFRWSCNWCLVGFAFEFIASGLLALGLAYFGLDSTFIYAFGIVMMGICNITSCFQLLPQIVETYKQKAVGSLSIFTTWIQAVGCGLTAINLAPHGSWEIWSPYVVQAVVGGFLTVEAIYYWYLERSASKNRTKQEEDEKYQRLRNPAAGDSSDSLSETNPQDSINHAL